VRWPVGVPLTAWRYLWRISVVHRWEMTGRLPADGSPALAPGISQDGLQLIDEGEGPLVHRIYRARIVGSAQSAESLMALVAGDLDRVAPSEFATFQRINADGRLALGDEYLVRMPGPWDGPVRVVATDATSFRLATLEGHLEAGQIEFRTRADHRSVEFEIESWARCGDRLSDLLYSRVGLSKEVQLHMWTSVLENVVRISGGTAEGGVTITTRRVDTQDPDGASSLPEDPWTARKLAALGARAVNFDVTKLEQYTPENGWRRDDLVQPLPSEPSGPPSDDGSWHAARRLMLDYQLADPRVVRAFYRPDAPLESRDMLLRISFSGAQFDVGVRIGEVYESTLEVDGRPAHVFGWYYRTLEGHFEQGQMHYELWKWLDTGDVQFRLFAISRPAERGPLLLRTGFRLFGRTHQLRFYREICRRAGRLTETQLEIERTARAATLGEGR
jgi:uncharacterized protein (UPF0548 family)